MRVMRDDMLLETRVRFGELFDAYSSLLTERQRTVCEMVISGDLSNSELAGELEMTRQGAYDLVKRSREYLEDVERSVGMLALRARYDALLKLIGENEDLLPDVFLEKLDKLNARSDRVGIEEERRDV
ncbi:MAG: DNA-binding protein [Synergistaceae bacterium]|nr:DNA-binding protein [Synergistaceae bacterium]